MYLYDDNTQVGIFFGEFPDGKKVSVDALVDRHLRYPRIHVGIKWETRSYGRGTGEVLKNVVNAEQS